jgi:multidrug resistance efflux pump
MRERSKLLASALVAAGVLCVAALAAGPAQNNNAAATDVIIPELLTTKLVWADERIVSSRIPGRIARRLVNDGAEVKEGIPLAELDYREAKLDYQTQKIIGDSQLALEGQNIKTEEYKVRQDTANRLGRTRAISKEDERLAQVNLDVNRNLAKQESEKHEVEKLKADRSKVIYDDHFINSPIDGLVQKCFKRATESVAAGEQMFRIVAVDKLWVEGLVPVQYVYRVQEGQRVTVQLVLRDAAGQPVPQAREVFEGRVVFIDPEMLPTGKDRFWVRGEVKNRRDAGGKYILRAGMPAEMKIYLKEQAADQDAANKA